MIYEFAVDPESIPSYDKFIYLYENFDVCEGRLISRFPKKWTRMVIESCRKKKERFRDVEITKVIELLNTGKDKFIRRERDYNIEGDTWLEKAMNSHNEREFRAIIAEKSDPDNAFVIGMGDISKEHPLWNVDTDQVCNRDVNSLTNCLSTLFEISKEIIFVDPNFNPCKERFRNTLQSFLKALVNVNPVVTDVEYHTISPLPDKMTEEDFNSYSNTLLPNIIPKDVSLHIYVWDKRLRGETMHARYILTDKGGISIDYGLDEAEGVGHVGETTDVRILGDGIYRRRWDEFKNPDKVFERCIDDLVILGKCGG